MMNQFRQKIHVRKFSEIYCFLATVRPLSKVKTELEKNSGINLLSQDHSLLMFHLRRGLFGLNFILEFTKFQNFLMFFIN